MELDLHKLGAFHAVATSGGFTKAAEKLHVTQPTISIQIKKLETQIGTRLFERLPRKVVLTKAGELLFEHTKRIQKLLLEVESTFLDLSVLKKGRLSLAVHQSTAMHVLPPHLETFTDLYPLVEVAIRTGSTPQIRDFVLNGTVELGIVLVPPQAEILASKQISRWEMVLIVPNNHPLTKGPIRLGRLTDYPFISYMQGATIQKQIDRPFDEQKSKPTVRLALGSTDLIIRYVALGHGIAIVHDLNFKSGVPKGIVTLPMSKYYSPGHLYLIWRKDHSLTLPSKTFCHILDSA